MSGRWTERSALSSDERKRLALVGDGSAAHQEGLDEGGRPVRITRLVILPALTPELIDDIWDERELPRTEVEAWTSEDGRTRWIELRPDAAPAPRGECDIPIEWSE